MGGSKKYFKNLDFNQCKSFEDIEEVITNDIPDIRGLEKVKIKLINLIGEYIINGVTGFSKDAISKVVVYDNFANKEVMRGDLILMALESRLIPVIQTMDLIAKGEIFANYMKYVIDMIQQYQKRKPGNKRPIIISSEEMNIILNTKNPGPILESLKSVVISGRGNKMGLFFNTQNLSEINNDIVTNCDYGFIGKIKEGPDMAMIKNFSQGKLDREDVSKIKNLNEMEFLGVSGKRNFVVYDILGNNRYETKKVWGITIPPLSHHKKHTTPSSKISSEDEQFLVKHPYCRQLLHENGIKFIDLNNPQKALLWKESASKSLQINKIGFHQGVDLRKIYFEKKSNDEMVGYNDLLERGYMIYYSKTDRYFYIGKAGNYRGNSIPYDKKPDKVKAIIFDLENRAYKLIGESCKEDWYEG